MFYQTINVYMQLSSFEKYSLLAHFVYLYIYIFHSQLEIFNLLRSGSPLFSVRIKSFFIKPNSRHRRGSHGSFTEIYKLCNIIQDIITYFKLYIQHSVCLYKILQRPFNIPQAFSVTARAEQSFLLKCFCCGSLVSSLYNFNSHEYRGNIESSIVPLELYQQLLNNYLILVWRCP